ncbi:tetratricopeptide repeat protein [Pontibacter sp. G13]|uniref:tetratricopeptide repeat protein n=1 Tax=Pontibacter sp. G13 TaxID=3074898 RepID=UPI00288B7796|nr:tetratricopeptide repeat protein [Pontibacter sp. G13]WNJ19825.1 tetratricopeptide repeat protein [Pontibacter sp. G13]
MNRNLRPILTFCLLVLVMGPVLAQTSQDWVNKGQEAVNEQRYQAALQLFDQAIQLDAKNASAHDYQGYAYLMLKQYAQAEMAFSTAIELHLYDNRARQRNPQGRIGNMAVALPGGTQSGSGKLARLYNNRGVARYNQRKTTAAIQDFNRALELDEHLQQASLNLKEANGTQAGRPSFTRPTTTNSGSTLTPNRRMTNAMYQRPPNAMEPVDPKQAKKSTVKLRDNRLEFIDMASQTRGGDRFAAPEVKNRKVPLRGKAYKHPDYAFATANYVTVEQVKILPKITVITFKVVNPTAKDYDVCVYPPRNPKAYYLTDGGESVKRRINLRKVSNIATYPGKTTLKPDEPLYFTLEFDKIPDNIHTIHIVEGGRDDGQAWNFYQVDLTKFRL